MTKPYQIFYKCVCNPYEQTLHVRQRRLYEDIAHYMKYVTKEVTQHHRALSPTCMSAKLSYLKMPVKEAKPIGNV